MDEDNRTLGEVITSILDGRTKEYSKVINDLFVYGPDILGRTINELKQQKNEDSNQTRSVRD